MQNRPTIQALALLPLLAGCYAAPDPDDPRRATTNLQRVFASDLSTAGFANRTRSLSSLLDELRREPARVEQIASAPQPALAAAARNLGELPDRAVGIATDELQRRPEALPHLRAEVGPDHVAARVADGLADLPFVLGMQYPVFGEHDDRRHRTDPHDDRPEATFWQRLRRRLRL